MSAFRTKNVFVNPFYQEGVGRRTGIVLNKNVRKHSDGFEVFDDYWSESESENDVTINRTHTNAAEKENHGTKPRLKKSSLKSMPSFSPAVTSSEREESKAEPLPQEVSQAAENASALEADLTGSIIKVPPSSLEPSSALCKFKTRQRLSFSAAASSEESQTTEGEGSVGDEGESQESGTSSEGTVKAPSSQSELSQEEGDSPTETEQEDVETGSEMQSSQATGETSSQEEGDVPDKAGAPSLSQDGEAQRRESKRRSTRGKPAQENSQDKSTRPDSDQDAIAAKERRSRKSSSQSKDVTGNRELCEKEGEEKIGVETRHRKSTCQSHKVTNDDEGDEMQKDTGKESRKSTQQLNISIPNENYPEKDNEKKADDTRRRKSTRRSNKVEKKEEEEKENEKENVKTRRSIRHANIVENTRDNVGKEKEDAKSTRRKSEKHSNAPVGKEIEEKEDECKDDKMAKGEREKVRGDKGDEVKDPATETEERAGETETGETETETGGTEVVEPVKEKTNVDAESEVKIKDAVTRKKEIVTVLKLDVGEDDDDDTGRVFFSLRASTAVPSVSNLEDEFDVADANPQEFGVIDDAMNKKHKKVERTSGQTVSKGGQKGRKKNDIKESQVDDKSEHLKRSTRKSTQKGKQESKKPKGQKDRAMKRGSSIHRDDDQKKSKESPEEAANGFKDCSKQNSGNKKSRGKKSNKQNDRLERSRRTSGSTSQASSSDTDAGSQPEDTMLDHKTKQRKQGRKKASDHPAEISRTGKKSEKTASGKTQEEDENGQSGGKPGSRNQVIRSHRSRRSSVHFTTKDMISVSGDISVHQVSSGEDDNANKRKAPPTPAALPVDKRNSRKSSKRKSSGSSAKTQDKTADNDIENEVERQSGQSESDSTAESEKENANQGCSRRGKKKGSKAKKRCSSLAVSMTSVTAAEEASGGKKRRLNRQDQERAKSATGSDGDEREGNAKDHTLHISVGHQESHHTEASARSPRDDTSNESTTASSNDQQEISSVRSLSTGSILKVSQNGGTRRQNKKKKYSILFTEKPLQKAYIIKPDEEDGVRRTRRQRVRPLEYWRNERPLYERRKSGGFALAGILSPEQPEKKEFSRSVRAPAKPKGHLPVTPSNISIHTTPPVGVSKVCQPTVNVVNPDSEQEVAIDAVARSKMLVFSGPSGLPAEPDDPITISKALSQKAFSAGVLTVRPFEEKGSQMVRRDTMVFYIVRGKIAMTLHETSQILQSGDFFFVPKGNVYNIKNLRKDEAKLTFFQLKSA